MADDLTPEQRRKNMQAIKSKDTSIELRLRKALWENGVRYRKNYNKLIGKPDIAITKYKIAVFCDSDYWHGYDWESRNQKIKSNRDYWVPKIERNMARDKEVTEALQRDGWLVMRFWEWQIKKQLNACIESVLQAVEARKQALKGRDLL
ncbi:very short patch repair endonuclease [Caproicibacterium lactatifermentans]|jgi:DNA mismatch endonuclease Vsr|uniref:Very short patch repair endonuclease n=1 Tax=Caproicibacterium lactatifermentans TaxID=2666138 RepID=A0A859DMJ6_9FIRM|nr:very short patch repair endonuclease [Caproicibacterium lactatifermentans]QKN23217.1 DNA mismatch endonuclease Vsr [Caproicibacterium lactatifermentans]